jgi:hypothetical protein
MRRGRFATLALAMLLTACRPAQPAFDQAIARTLIEESLSTGRPLKGDGGVWDDFPIACPSYERLMLPVGVTSAEARGERAEATFTFSFSERRQLFDKDASEATARAQFAAAQGGWRLERVSVVSCR